MILLSTPTDDEKEEMLGARFQAMFILHQRWVTRINILFSEKSTIENIPGKFRVFNVMLIQFFIQTVLYYQFWKRYYFQKTFMK